MRNLIMAGLASVSLSACATIDNRPMDDRNSCRAEPGQAFVGQVASSELGARMLAATGSREIRWVPPGTMVTMDLKFGRLTVGYDEAMRITTVSCT